MSKKNSKLLIGIFGILILVIIIGLLMNNKMNLNSQNNKSNSTIKNDNYKDSYLKFINNQEYNKDDILEEYSEKSYVIYDLNKDGIDELILRFQSKVENGVDYEWEYLSFYTYNKENSKVEFIETVYAWTGIRYNTKTNEIVYTEVKTTGLGDGTRGNSLGFYQLIDNKLVLNRTISYIINLETDQTSYTEKTLEDNEKSLSSEEYENIQKDEIQFDYTNIK